MGITKELLGGLVTIPRYLLAEDMARRVKEGTSIVPSMGVFIALDISDGEIMRRLDDGQETPFRRTLDGVVDYASQGRVMFEVARKYPETIPFITTLAIGAITAGAMNIAHYKKTGEVTKGQNWQRAANLAAAAFGCIAARGGRTMKTMGVMAIGASIANVLAHANGIGVKHPGDIRKL